MSIAPQGWSWVGEGGWDRQGFMNAFLLGAGMFGFVQVTAALSPPQTLALIVFLSPSQWVFLGLWGRVAWMAHLCLCIALVLNLCTLTDCELLQ